MNNDNNQSLFIYFMIKLNFYSFPKVITHYKSKRRTHFFRTIIQDN